MHINIAYDKHVLTDRIARNTSQNELWREMMSRPESRPQKTVHRIKCRSDRSYFHLIKSKWSVRNVYYIGILIVSGQKSIWEIALLFHSDSLIVPIYLVMLDESEFMAAALAACCVNVMFSLFKFNLGWFIDTALMRNALKKVCYAIIFFVYFCNNYKITQNYFKIYV